MREDIVNNKLSIDLETALAVVVDNKELQQFIIDTFINNYHGQLKSMQESFLNSDVQLLSKCAHSLKGSSCMIEAHKVFELAQKLEDLGKTIQLDEAKSITDVLPL